MTRYFIKYNKFQGTKIVKNVVLYLPQNFTKEA
jgi:hypothetical protein